MLVLGLTLLGVKLTTTAQLAILAALVLIALLSGIGLLRRLRSARAAAAPEMEERNIDLSSRLGKLIDGVSPPPAAPSPPPVVPQAAAPSPLLAMQTTALDEQTTRHTASLGSESAQTAPLRLSNASVELDQPGPGDATPALQTAPLNAWTKPQPRHLVERGPSQTDMFTPPLATQEIGGPLSDAALVGAQSFEYRAFAGAWKPLYTDPAALIAAASSAGQTAALSPQVLGGVFPAWPTGPDLDDDWAAVINPEPTTGSADAGLGTTWLPSQRAASDVTALPPGQPAPGQPDDRASTAPDTWATTQVDGQVDQLDDQDDWATRPNSMDHLSAYPISPVVEAPDPQVPRRTTGDLDDDQELQTEWAASAAGRIPLETPQTGMLPGEVWPHTSPAADMAEQWALSASPPGPDAPVLASDEDTGTVAPAPVPDDIIGEGVVDPGRRVALEERLAGILTHAGVLRAAIVRRDGHAMTGALHDSGEAEREASTDAVLTATLAASMRCTGFANAGAFDSLTITGNAAILLLVEVGPLGLLAVLVRKDTKIGLLRRALRKQVEAIKEILGSTHVS